MNEEKERDELLKRVFEGLDPNLVYILDRGPGLNHWAAAEPAGPVLFTSTRWAKDDLISRLLKQRVVPSIKYGEHRWGVFA